MANRFWVLGTGPWDNTSTANWAATSGGAAGQSPPVSGDNVTFDASSGGGTVTFGANVAMSTVNMTNGTQQFSNAGGYTLTVTSTGGAFTNGASITLAHPVTVIFNNNTATSKSFAGASVSEANSWSCSVTGGSGAFTITGVVRDLTFGGTFTGALTNSTHTIFGNETLVAGMTETGGALSTTYGATSGTKTITNAGVVRDRPSIFNGVGGAWQLADAMAHAASRAFTMTNGTFNANGFNVTVGSFGWGAGTKTLTLGSGTWTCLAGWNANSNVTNATVSASTGTISMTSAGAVTFSGGALTWPTLNIGGAGPITIAQSNTFTNITNTVQPCTVRLTFSTTQTFTTAFSLSGASGNLVTLDSSSAGSAATVSKASGTVSARFMSIKDSAAAGGAAWNAIDSTNVSGNTGWVFSNSPVTGSAEGGSDIQSFLNYGRL